MTLTPKENLLRAISHRGPEWVPYAGEGAWQFVDCRGRRPPESGLDEWGVTWSPLPASYVSGEGEPAASYPSLPAAASTRAWLDLPVPDAADPCRYAGLSDGIDTGRVLVIGQHPAGPLDRLVSLLGMAQAMAGLLVDAEASEAALNRIAEYHVQVAQGYVAAGVGAAWLADDYAGQDGPFLRPALWRRLVLPGLAHIISTYARAGTPVFFHTCGRAEPFIADLIEAGVTAFNLESGLCDLRALKAHFGERISFFGGLSVRVMLLGSPADVRQEARSAVLNLGCDGGLVLAPDQPLVFPTANEVALREAARQYGRYPLACQAPQAPTTC